MNYIEVKIEILPFSEEFAEIVEAMLCELSFESFVIEDPYLLCYISQDDFDIRKTKTVLSFFDNNPEFKVKESHSLILNQNWNKEWESSFSPIRIGDIVVIKAPFHKDQPKAKYNIKIEPRMAFGTGHHQTTMLMLSSILLLSGVDISDLPENISVQFYGDAVLPSRNSSGKVKNLLSNASVLDMGTGTGILAILAAKLDAKRPVHAIDIDMNSVDSALTNVWTNRLSRAVDVLCGDSSLIYSNRYNFVFANINRNILLEDMEVYSDSLKRNGMLILSGFYTRDVKVLVDKAKQFGLELSCELVVDDWAAVILKKFVV